VDNPNLRKPRAFGAGAPCVREGIMAAPHDGLRAGERKRKNYGGFLSKPI